MAAKTLLLDLDGTIWDSRPWFTATISRLGGVRESEIEAYLTKDANVIHLAKRYGTNKQQLASTVYEKEIPIVLYEGVPRVLRQLLDRSVTIALVTNLSRTIVTPVLEVTNLKNCFATIVTPRHGVRAKPRPDGISKALMEMDRSVTESTWYLGDRLTDAKAARAANVRFAWASYGYEQEEPPGTEVVLNHFSDALLL
ncbi:MAG: HAD family hydrolase [Gammaproteobacteria bacterium]|nr:HAD family hydrolase [Gammaproteobacteria bacterium]MYF02017.1 HAD family hydrolase [Gammaproteobacteria bacterium]MYI77551.1 HAD family hydrolase [Gammaproteobacteria bacterium]